jgi:hypothetical protein
MRRTATVVLSLLATAALTAWATAPKPEDKKADPRPEGKAVTPAEALERRNDFAGYDDPKTTLAEALANLTDRYGVSFEINERAFKSEMLQEVGKTEIATPNPIPGRKNARLEGVLTAVLARLPVQSGATFMVRRDHIEITTAAFQRNEVWGEGYEGPFLPLVHTRFVNKPLAEALDELAEQAQFNIVLSPKAADKVKTLINARMNNVPLDTAVSLLARMSDLRSVQRDNVLLVTTPEQAAEIEKQYNAEAAPPEGGVLNPFFPLPGIGGPCLPFFNPLAPAVDRAKYRKGAGPSRVAPKDAGAGGM